jgi:hypothetical protein
VRRVYADENVWLPVVEGLRRREWDVTSALEENTLGATDAVHLEYASERGWAVLTFDDDFLSLVDETDIQHAGIVYVPQHGRDVGELVRPIDATLENNAGRDIDDEIRYA